MGKKNIIKSLGKCIGTIALHKFLLERTKRKESEKHLGDEVRDYSEDAFEKAQIYAWNDKEKQEIIEKALIRVKNLIKRYEDLEYDDERINEIILDVIDNLLI